MTVQRDKTWYLLNHDPELEALEVEIDLAAGEVWDERYVAWMKTRERLQRLGFDTSKFRPPPRPARAEQYSRNHIRKDEDIEQLVVQEQRSELDKIYEQHIANRTGEATDKPVVLHRLLGHVTGIR